MTAFLVIVLLVLPALVLISALIDYFRIDP